MQVIEMKQSNRSDSVKEALRLANENADNFDVLIVIAIQKDNSQWMTTSESSGYEKSFLLAFFQAWMTSWFRIGDQ